MSLYFSQGEVLRRQLLERYYGSSLAIAATSQLSIEGGRGSIKLHRAGMTLHDVQVTKWNIEDD